MQFALLPSHSRSVIQGCLLAARIRYLTLSGVVHEACEAVQRRAPEARSSLGRAPGRIPSISDGASERLKPV